MSLLKRKGGYVPPPLSVDEHIEQAELHLRQVGAVVVGSENMTAMATISIAHSNLALAKMNRGLSE